MTASEIINPLISIIIPCYNHAHYLEKAIQSVLAQSYPSIEILVVNDGSTDHTEEIVNLYPEVIYIKKVNQGLSATRNTGFKKSKGEYVVFLDADDWLFPLALETNFRYLNGNVNAAFVSGAFERDFVEDERIIDVISEVTSMHYLHLLQGNYIGMPAVVMYRRWVLEEFPFDLSAPDSCGDYDLGLRITRKYPVIHHTEKIATYSIHGQNMSSNIPLMLNAVLLVLKRQKRELQTFEEKSAYKKGIRNWKKYYAWELFKKLKEGKISLTFSLLSFFIRYQPKSLLRLVLLK